MKDKYKSYKCNKCGDFTEDYIILSYKIVSESKREKHILYFCNECFETIRESIENE